MGEIMAGKTWMEDCFAGWSIGYIMYDFPTLFKTYGNGASIIALHHMAEAVIVYTYTVNRIGSLYLMGGGLMQLSSGLLHVQRMMHITGYSSNAFTRLINWLLIFFWFHARLLIFPYIMYICFRDNPLGFLHIFSLIVGSILCAMNGFWMYKIVRMKSLAF